MILLSFDVVAYQLKSLALFMEEHPYSIVQLGIKAFSTAKQKKRST